MKSFIIGVCLILWGISWIFNLGLPVFRIVFGLFIIYMGISILRGSQPKERCMNCACAVDILFDDEFVQTHEGPYEYSTVFGKSVIDLSKLTQATNEHPIEIKIDTIFGKTDVKLNRSIPVSIKVTAAFAKADFPDDTVIAFGSRAYRSSHEEPRIIINTSTVFGETDFSYKN